MEQAVEKQDQKINIIFEQFNQILAEHIGRLLGTSLGIGGLPLNLVTISCLIFLAEQNADERDNFSTPRERYTCETLFKELEEVGLGPKSILKNAVEDMRQKEYIQLDEVGLISAKKPLLDTVQLLERIFPKMPGLNLVAYIAQTIDETITGRKEIDHALSQFHQALLLQGAPIKKGKSQPGKKQRVPVKPIIQPQKSSPFYDNDQRKSSEGSLIPSGDYKRLYRTDSPKEDSPAPSGSQILSSSSGFSQADIQEVKFGNTVSRPAEPEQAPQEGDEQANHRIMAGFAQDTAEAIEKTLSSTEISVNEPLTREADVIFSENEELESDMTPPAQLNEHPRVTQKEHENNIVADDQSVDNVDDIIETQIAAFEEDLALQCPLCKTNRIIAEKTMKGKAYYKCPNKSCNFISWGKPHHHVCPRCNNPFLVESEKKGETVLKCPRSTCGYWRADLDENTTVFQNDAGTGPHGAAKKVPSSKPRRRVVKRRVVRRKKQAKCFDSQLQ